MDIKEGTNLMEITFIDSLIIVNNDLLFLFG